MGGARDIDSKRLLRRSGIGAFCTVPLQCHQNNVQTNIYDPDGTERHRRFYLAVNP
jgi:hypothetical protein